MNHHHFQPEVLFANNFIEGMTMPVNSSLANRDIYDYELELITDSDQGAMLQDGLVKQVSKGDIIFSRPGEKTKAMMRYSSYIFSFDLMMGRNIPPKPYVLMEPKAFQVSQSHELIDQLPKMFHTLQYEFFFEMFKEVIDCFASEAIGRDNYLSALVTRLLYHLNKEVGGSINVKHDKVDMIRDVLGYIDQNIMGDLSLETLSKEVALSTVYFHQLFLEITGTTLKSYVIEKRMVCAKSYLTHTTLSVKEVGIKSGYIDPAYFCYAFKKAVGISPLSYRRERQLSFSK